MRIMPNSARTKAPRQTHNLADARTGVSRVEQCRLQGVSDFALPVKFLTRQGEYLQIEVVAISKTVITFFGCTLDVHSEVSCNFAELLEVRAVPRPFRTCVCVYQSVVVRLSLRLLPSVMECIPRT